MRPIQILVATFVLVLSLAAMAALGPSRAQTDPAGAVPSAAQAAELLRVEGPVQIIRQDTPVPGWRIDRAEGPVGFIASTWEVANSVGYSGRPIDILVAVTPGGAIAGATLVRHNEPIMTLGISPEDIAAFVDRFADIDLTQPALLEIDRDGGQADIISGATVSSGVIRDAIYRTARAVAQRQAGSGLDRVSFRHASWAALIDAGALVGTEVTLADAQTAFADAKVPIPDGDGTFLELWVALLDPPTIGRNLLGQHKYSQIVGGLALGDAALLVLSNGLQSHRGTSWRRSKVFDRVTVIQGDEHIQPTAESYIRIDKLAAAGAPDFKEMSVFILPAGRFDPTAPFRVQVTASRAADGRDITLEVPLDYALPGEFVLKAPAGNEFEPLWLSSWRDSRWRIAGVGLMLAVLAAILFLQQSFVRRPKLWRVVRLSYLTVTLVWLGWMAGGQLSVVQVVAFLHSLLSGFRWETFLIEPVIFIIWSFVALGLLFWGRGVFCGWLCPFGALQELTNNLGQRLGVPQISLPFALHERLWVIKYTLFLAILALSFHSMGQALVLAEVEPFKTAISLHFVRAWPFVAFVVVLLVAGLFIERFYCRYLCPLGAALAIPAKLKLFDWLRRRSQCGRECRLCERKCTVGAIDPIGRINPNECVLCLRCQVIFHDPQTCTVLKRRPVRPPAKKSAPQVPPK